MGGLATAIARGLSSAGYAAGDLYSRGALADQQSDLALQREMRLKEFEDTLKNAPLNRLTAKAKNYAQEDVPQEAAPVRTLSGDRPPPVDNVGPPAPGGFAGDVSTAAQAVTGMPEGPDRDAALAQLRDQITLEQGRAQDAVAGKTRKRTSGEALQAAVDDAKANDLPAYAAYENQIGKPMRDERRLDIQAQREDNRATLAMTAEQRKERQMQQSLEMQLRRLDLQSQSLDAQNKKIDAMIDHWERRDDISAQGKAGAQERASTIVKAMNATIRDPDNNKPSSKASDDEKRAWLDQRSNAVAVRARAMNKLNDALADNAPSPAPNPAPGAPAVPPAPAASAITTLPPGARQIGTSGGKPVYESADGKRWVAQ